MELIPAIDLLNGEVVRLRHGNFDDSKHYDVSAIQLAKIYAKEGAQWLHIVDLAASRDGNSAHPELVLQICEKWYGYNERTDWIVRHACRGLLKSGNQRALTLFGFSKPTHVKIDKLTLNKRRAAIGENLHFSFDVKSSRSASEKIRFEYVIYFRKANGK